jgi:tRNA pseudouridine-54 N-methylase
MISEKNKKTLPLAFAVRERVLVIVVAGKKNPPRAFQVAAREGVIVVVVEKNKTKPLQSHLQRWRGCRRHCSKKKKNKKNPSTRVCSKGGSKGSS